MNLATMRKVCASYHGKTIQDLTDADTGADLYLTAVNNARKTAERDHNFEDTSILGALMVAHTTGGALADVVISPPNIFSGVREVVSVHGMGTNGTQTPLTIRRPNQGFQRNIPARYPTDAQAVSSGCNYLIFRGGYLFQYPDLTGTADLDIEIEGYGWLNDYTDAMLVDTAATPDFIVEHGFEFLQWSVIIELNYKFQTFVFRQEGNPGSPERLKQAAWESLVNWDSYRIGPHVTDDR